MKGRRRTAGDPGAPAASRGGRPSRQPPERAICRSARLRRRGDRRHAPRRRLIRFCPTARSIVSRRTRRSRRAALCASDQGAIPRPTRATGRGESRLQRRFAQPEVVLRVRAGRRGAVHDRPGRRATARTCAQLCAFLRRRQVQALDLSRPLRRRPFRSGRGVSGPCWTRRSAPAFRLRSAAAARRGRDAEIARGDLQDRRLAAVRVGRPRPFAPAREHDDQHGGQDRRGGDSQQRPPSSGVADRWGWRCRQRVVNGRLAP